MRNPQKNHFCGMQSKQNWLSGYPGKPPISSYAGTQAVSQRHQRLAMFALWWNYIYNYIYIYKSVGSKTSTYFLAVCNTCDIPIGSHWCARNVHICHKLCPIYLMTYDIWTVLEAIKTTPHSLGPPRKVS